MLLWKFYKNVVTVSDTDIESLKRKTHELLEQQRENETAFAQQRAKFMELFKQKEGCEFALFFCEAKPHLWLVAFVASCTVSYRLIHITN